MIFKRAILAQILKLTVPGPKPARGYFAKPEAAKLKSLPIVLLVHAAGVSGSWCLAQPENAINYANMGKGALPGASFRSKGVQSNLGKHGL